MGKTAAEQAVVDQGWRWCWMDYTIDIATDIAQAMLLGGGAQCVIAHGNARASRPRLRSSDPWKVVEEEFWNLDPGTIDDRFRAVRRAAQGALDVKGWTTEGCAKAAM